MALNKNQKDNDDNSDDQDFYENIENLREASNIPAKFNILPLYSQLSPEKQYRVF